MLARLLRRAPAAAADALPAARAVVKTAPAKRALHTSSRLLKDLKTEPAAPAQPLTPEQIAAFAAERKEHLVAHVRKFAGNKDDGVTAESIRDNLVRELGANKILATIGGKIVMAAIRRTDAWTVGLHKEMTTVQEVVRVLKHPDAVYGNPGAFARLATPMSEGGRYSQVLKDKNGKLINDGNPVVFALDLYRFVLTETCNGYAWKTATSAQRAGAIMALISEWRAAQKKANLRLEGADPLDNKALVKKGNPNAALLPMWKRPIASVQNLGETLGVLKPTTPAPKR